MSQSDTITRDLVRAGGEKRLVNDAEVEHGAAAFVEAKELDPVAKGSVLLYWAIGLLMLMLSVIAGAKTRAAFEPNPVQWNTDTFTVLFFMVVQVGVSAAGTADYLWVKNDLQRRLDASTLGVVRKAVRAREAGDLTEAIALATTVVDRLPSWPWTYAFRGHLYSEKDAREDSLRDFDRAVALDPGNPWYRIARAERRLASDNPEGAWTDLTALDEELPREPSVSKLMGSTLYRLGRKEEAVRMFSQAVNTSPNDSEARVGRATALVGDYAHPGTGDSPTGALVELVLEEGERVAVRTLSRVGRESLSRSDLDTALQDFSFGLQQQPGDRSLLHQRGKTYFLKGDFSSGEKDFESALDGASPGERAVSLRLRGLAYERAGRKDRAEADFTESLAATPTHQAYFYRALLSAANSRYEEALADLDAALKLAPDNDDYLSHRADVLMMLGDIEKADAEYRVVELAHPRSEHNYQLWINGLLRAGKAAEALEVVERAMNACGETPSMLLLRADVNVANRRYGQAERDLQVADLGEADPVRISHTRSSIYRELGKLQEAEDAISTAAETQSPSQHIALANRATLRRKRRDMSGALTDLDRAISLDPENAVFYVSRGCLKASIDLLDGALEDYSTALTLDPENVSAFLHRAGYFMAVGQQQEALADADRVFALLEGAPTEKALETRAQILFTMQNWGQASAAYRDLLDRRPDDQVAMWQLAAAYDNNHDFLDAEAIFEKLARQDPSNLSARAGLAVSISQQGRSEEAVQAFADLRRDFPGDIDRWMSTSLHADILPCYETVMADWARCATV